MAWPKGRPQSPELIEKRRLAVRGFHHTPEWREHMRQIALAQHEERSKRWQGRKHTPETREKMRLVALNRTPEHRQHLSEAMKKRAQTSEFRETSRSRALGNQWGLGYKHSPGDHEAIRQARLRQSFPLTDIERILYAEFKKRRLKFETHKAMFGRWQPDFVFGDAKLVVQADGGYWHNRRGNPQQVARDDAFNAEAAAQGWTVFRFSDTQIKMNAASCARAVARFVRDHP